MDAQTFTLKRLDGSARTVELRPFEGASARVFLDGVSLGFLWVNDESTISMQPVNRRARLRRPFANVDDAVVALVAGHLRGYWEGEG